MFPSCIKACFIIIHIFTYLVIFFDRNRGLYLAVSSSINSNLLPKNVYLSSSNRETWLGATYAEYGDCWSNSKYNWCVLAIVFIYLWHGTLSWRESTLTSSNGANILQFSPSNVPVGPLIAWHFSWKLLNNIPCASKNMDATTLLTDCCPFRLLLFTHVTADFTLEWSGGEFHLLLHTDSQIFNWFIDALLFLVYSELTFCWYL